MRRNHARRLWMVLGVLVAVCALAEGAARAFGAPVPYSAIFQSDPVLGYRYVAGAVVAFSVGPARYRIEFDHEGLVDRAGPRPELVVILGDGVVAGLELPPERRLARLVAAAGRS